MLGAAIVIGMTRSASGHAADWGDLNIPEMMDWLHLMAVSAWGGTIFGFSSVILPMAVKSANPARFLIAESSRRFSTLSGLALGILVITAMYNAWLEVVSFPALWNTGYGRVIITKIILLLALALLGASNRYFSVPHLRQWAGHPVKHPGFSLGRLFAGRPGSIRRGVDGALVARKFLLKVRIEAILVTGVIVCTAFLLHSIPARHLSHLGHTHEMHEHSEHGEE